MIGSVRLGMASVVCVVSIVAVTPSRAALTNGPALEISDVLGQAYYSPMMIAGHGGQVTTAWSTKAGQTYVVRVNVRKARSTLLTTIPGIAVAMTVGREDSFYLALQTALFGEVKIVKLSPVGHLLWSHAFPDDGKGAAVQGMVADSSGNVYATGYTDSAAMGTPGAFQPVPLSTYSAYVRKLSPQGRTVYSTYVGGPTPPGTLAGTYGSALAVDASGDVYVTGSTFSTDFPLVNPIQSQPRSIFLSELDPSGSRLLFSTYLGGKTGYDSINVYGDEPSAMVRTKDGSIYIVGSAVRGFPTTAHAFQRVIRVPKSPNTIYGTNGFIMKLRPDRTIAYSTYLGGSADDSLSDVAVDARGDAVVVGTAVSTNFPLANPLQPIHGSGVCSTGGEDRDQYTCADGVVSVLNPAGSKLLESTYLGGRKNDRATHVALDAGGAAIVEGVTKSPVFPRSRRVTLDPSVPVCSVARLKKTRCQEVFLARITDITADAATKHAG